MDEFEDSDGVERHTGRSALGERLSRRSVTVLVVALLVLGIGSVVGALMLTAGEPSSPSQSASQSQSQAQAQAQAQGESSSATTSSVKGTNTTTAARGASAGPAGVALPAPTTSAPNPGASQTSTSLAPSATTVPPTTVPRPAGRTCRVPDLLSMGTGQAERLLNLFTRLVAESGCRDPIESNCINPAIPAGLVREVAQSPAPGTAIDANAIWYHTSHWSPTAATEKDYPPC